MGDNIVWEKQKKIETVLLTSMVTSYRFYQKKTVKYLLIAYTHTLGSFPKKDRSICTRSHPTKMANVSCEGPADELLPSCSFPFALLLFGRPSLFIFGSFPHIHVTVQDSRSFIHTHLVSYIYIINFSPNNNCLPIGVAFLPSVAMTIGKQQRWS